MRRLFLRTHALERWIRWRFTPTGRLLLGALVAVGLFSLNPRASSAYQLAVVILAAVFAAMLWAPWFRPRVRVQRQLPGFATAGQPFRYRIRIWNDSLRPLRGACIREDLPLSRHRAGLPAGGGYRGFLRALHLRQGFASKPFPVQDCLPGAWVDVMMSMAPSRRGYVELPGVLLHRADPLGIFNAFHRVRCPVRLLCLPVRYPVAAFAPAGAARASRAGASPARVSGAGLDFARLREYRPGDAMRHIDWRAWARIGEPVVKEFQEEAPARSALILDTAPAAGADAALFETAVSVAASFAVESGWHGPRVDLLFAGRALTRVAQGREQEGIARMLECLACVAPERDGDFLHLSALVKRLIGGFGSCVVVLLRLDEEREALLAALAAGGARMWVMWVHPAEEVPERTHINAGGVTVPLVHVPVGRAAQALARLGQGTAGRPAPAGAGLRRQAGET